MTPDQLITTLQHAPLANNPLWMEGYILGLAGVVVGVFSVLFAPPGAGRGSQRSSPSLPRGHLRLALP